MNDPRGDGRGGSARRLHGRQGMRTLALFAAILLVHCMPVPDEETALPPGGAETATAPAAAASEERAVRAVVEQFGQRLRNVSVLGPTHVLESSIGREYAPYVTPELLASWLAEPTSAPGRLASSPWPERIEITTVTAQSSDRYSVEGEIVESASAGESPGRTPVRIDVSQSYGGWRISSFVTAGGPNAP